LSSLTGTAADRGFPEGTVVAKILTAQIGGEPALGGKAATGDYAKLPWLTNPILLEVYAAKAHDIDGAINRSIQKLPVIQMDLMVRDRRAPSTWIFATYVYNGQANPGATGAAKWKNLIPVGIQWGNDPDVTAPDAESDVFARKGMKPNNTLDKTANATRIVAEIKQTTINPNTTGPAALPGTHLGWNGRLNGPADNLQSSCMSCHSSAQYPPAAINPQFLKDKADTVPAKLGDATWMKWFNNHDCRIPFDPDGRMFPGSMGLPEFIQHWFNAWQSHGGALSADCSLQLSEGIESFYDEKMKTPINDIAAQSYEEQ